LPTADFEISGSRTIWRGDEERVNCRLPILKSVAVDQFGRVMRRRVNCQLPIFETTALKTNRQLAIGNHQ
jgi:hypothetical protein